MTHPRRAALPFLAAAILTVPVAAGAAPAKVAAPPTVVRAGRLLDPGSGSWLVDQAIQVQDGRITAVAPWSPPPAGTEVIDLRNASVLPGLVDAHTHLLARLDPEEDYATVLVTRSQPYRALEGAASARATLLAGFTTVRDVESEGAGFADAALRDAIAAGLVPGPRMQVSTRGIAAVGGYFPMNVAPAFAASVEGAQQVSGTEEMRRAVREQIRGGADLVKLYVDWLDRGGRPMRVTLTPDEIRTAVEEAHLARRKVAAHAMTVEGIRAAVAAGVDSIEHGHGMDSGSLKAMAAKGIAWVPTTAFLFEWAEAGGPQAARAAERMEALRKSIAEARRLGVRIACGSDPASAKEHGRNARELEALVRLGLTPAEAIRAATTEGAALMGLGEEIGTIEVGKRADLVAVDGDPLADVAALGKVRFVMKGGAVVSGGAR